MRLEPATRIYRMSNRDVFVLYLYKKDLETLGIDVEDKQIKQINISKYITDNSIQITLKDKGVKKDEQ